MLDQLYREHHAPALRTLQRLIRPADQAEDALQAAWVILARRLQRQPDYLDVSTARAWLVTVARHEHYATTKRLREDAASDRLDFLAHVDRSGAQIHAHLELVELLEAMDGLTREQARSQVAAMLGLSYKQEQQACGITYTNVNRHRTEGRAKLRAQLA